MGIYSRDYIRDSDPGSYYSGGGGGMSMTTKIIITTAVIFLLQLVITRRPTVADFLERLPRGFLEQMSDEEREQFLSEVENSESGNHVPFMPRISVVEDWFALSPGKVFHGQVWRLVTHAFCHSRYEIWHILLNMYIFWLFGRTLEVMYGSREFLLFYLVSAAFAGLCYLVIETALGNRSSALGASGAVMAVLMLYATHYPRQKIYIWGILGIEIRWIVAIYIIIDLHPILMQLGGDELMDNVAHSAHLGGLAFGFLYRKFNLRLENWLGRIPRPNLKRRFSSKRKIRLYRPPETPSQPSRQPDLDARVDRILEKISRDGEASLTDEERALLKEASQRYKGR